jgi:hypothetical protein
MILAVLPLAIEQAHGLELDRFQGHGLSVRRAALPVERP